MVDGGDDPGAQRLGNQEAAIDLLVGEAAIEAVVVAVDRDPRGVELLLDRAEVIEGCLQPPGAHLVARLAARLDLRRPQLAVVQTAFGHRLDDDIDGVPSGAREIPEAVGLHADLHAADVGECEGAQRQRSEFPSRIRHGGATIYNDGPPETLLIVTTALPFILLLFIGSGAAALIYEIVWFQVLTLVARAPRRCRSACSSPPSWAGCVSAASCCRGLYRSDAHPLRVYAVLELAIGVCGLVLLVVMPVVGRVYTEWGGYGFTGLLLRGVAASICLLPPTLAMGATLPAISRWVESTPRGVALARILLCRQHRRGRRWRAGRRASTCCACYDVATATYVAAALNATVGVLGAGARRDSHAYPAARRRRTPTSAPAGDAATPSRSRAGRFTCRSHCLAPARWRHR